MKVLLIIHPDLQKLVPVNKDDALILQLLDPIDGTKGFLKGEDSLYVVCLFVFIV